MIYVMNMRSAETGGYVMRGEITNPVYSKEPDVRAMHTGTEEQLRTASNVLFLIHGFNNHGTDGETKLLRWARNLNLADEWHIVVVLWPGDAKYIGFACYPFEGFHADSAGELLADRIEDLFGKNSSVRICMATHSLGARVALEAVKKLNDKGWSKIGNLCVMAAALDGTCLGSDSQYRQAVRQQVSDIGVLYSHWDGVLGGAFPAGELFQNFLFFWHGEEFSVQALGYWGPQDLPSCNIKTPDNVTSPTNAGNLPGNYHYGHGNYIGYDSPDFLNGMRRANVETWLKGRLGLS